MRKSSGYYIPFVHLLVVLLSPSPGKAQSTNRPFVLRLTGEQYQRRISGPITQDSIWVWSQDPALILSSDQLALNVRIQSKDDILFIGFVNKTLSSGLTNNLWYLDSLLYKPQNEARFTKFEPTTEKGFYYAIKVSDLGNLDLEPGTNDKLLVLSIHWRNNQPMRFYSKINLPGYRFTAMYFKNRGSFRYYSQPERNSFATFTEEEAVDLKWYQKTWLWKIKGYEIGKEGYGTRAKLQTWSNDVIMFRLFDTSGTAVDLTNLDTSLSVKIKVGSKPDTLDTTNILKVDENYAWFNPREVDIIKAAPHGQRINMTFHNDQKTLGSAAVARFKRLEWYETSALGFWMPMLNYQLSKPDTSWGIQAVPLLVAWGAKFLAYSGRFHVGVSLAFTVKNYSFDKDNLAFSSVQVGPYFDLDGRASIGFVRPIENLKAPWLSGWKIIGGFGLLDIGAVIKFIKKK